MTLPLSSRSPASSSESHAFSRLTGRVEPTSASLTPCRLASSKAHAAVTPLAPPVMSHTLPRDRGRCDPLATGVARGGCGFANDCATVTQGAVVCRRPSTKPTSTGPVPSSISATTCWVTTFSGVLASQSTTRTCSLENSRAMPFRSPVIAPLSTHSMRPEIPKSPPILVTAVSVDSPRSPALARSEIHRWQAKYGAMIVAWRFSGQSAASANHAAATTR